MDKQEKRLAKWEKIKSKGLMSYMLKTGILYYGLSFFLTWVFLVPFIESSYTFNFIYKETFTTKLIVFGIISPLFGMLMGYTGWKGFEKKYE
ncbi:hypothetical protein [Clostridium aciditolerans]|uniref:Uncharacterized protein n=1 Tax=Clostridium aciditolerans TaxID=339861 RepID=A0A934M329_9CLOT|nr:hypothetical protein [Clostridium aciditolerans]MBI6871228.1 hypothetical protein [Clostridium aciditolerans]